MGLLSAGLLVGLFLVSPASVNASVFTVEIRAEIPDFLPIVGWGIDVWYDEATAGTPAVTIGPDWYELVAQSPDPDDPTVDLNLQGITDFPDPTPGLVGNRLLATLVFNEAMEAPVALTVGDHNPWNGQGDLNEGFAVEPPPINNFAPPLLDGGFYVDITPDDAGVFTIAFIPEPATLSLLVLGGLMLRRRR
jgi:hypothetical protein